jgi:hypothetical protein
MKRIFFGVGFLLLCITTRAQRVYHAYETGITTLDTLTHTWNDDHVKPADLTITFQNKVVRINDREKSTYHLKKVDASGLPVLTEEYWLNAVDQNSISCDLSVYRLRTGTTRIEIIYHKGQSVEGVFYNVTNLSE